MSTTIYIVIGLIFTIVMGYGIYYLIMKKLCTSGDINWLGQCAPCGSLTQKCCEESCDESLVCVEGYCTTCGGVTQPCCKKDPACRDYANVCNGKNLCEHCGADKEPCCNGNKCADETMNCDGKNCIQCGGYLEGQPCCLNGQPCMDRFYCDDSKHCFKCGSIGNPCCAGEQPCYDGTYCDGKNCTQNQCGGADKPCCERVPACSDPSYVCTGKNYCEHCGADEEPCCDGNKCTDENTNCVGGNCIQCGGYFEGQQCCLNGQPCMDRFYCDDSKKCFKCGSIGNPCCTGKQLPCYDGTHCAADKTCQQ